MNSIVTVILDLDGVLITTPVWKAVEMDSDNYSKFDKSSVFNLNNLLAKIDSEIHLSSSRRTNKSLAEFNKIFEHRKINQPITDFIPLYKNCKNRREEILQFIQEKELSNILIIDDDKSLNGLPKNLKDRLVLTELLKGFDNDKLIEAQTKLGI